VPWSWVILANLALDSGLGTGLRLLHDSEVALLKLFPAPARHWVFRADVRAGLRDRQRDAAPPLEVLAKAAAKPLVLGQAHLVGGVHEHLDEAATLLLGDRQVSVVAEQRAVSSQLARVNVGSAEDFTQPRREMFNVAGSPPPAEHRGQDRIRE